MVSKAAVVGIDLGVDASYVGFVGKGIVDVVQNEVSKRNTATLVGFTDRERLLGDSALAKIKSNAKNSCRNFKHLLGQKIDSPMVEKEKFWSTCPLETASDGNVGYAVTFKGESRVFSAPQIAAMHFSKLRDISESWCAASVADMVIAVPSYYSDIHRQAILDAAKIANMPVLRVMNEHTATALSYGIYRSAEFDETKPCTVAFCGMGHSMFSVSVVQFVKGKLTVVTEASDKVGGRDMDECLMRVFAGQFQKKFGCDPLSNKKASFKLEDSVAKTKKILSSNYEAGVNVECLMEDEDFSSSMTRDDFEAMCQPMMDKVKAVLEKAKAGAAAAGVAVESIDFIEVVGGSSRVPWVKKMISEAFSKPYEELSFTMNADESVARGAALQAAILSPLYKVRDFKIEDFSPHSISVGWMGSAEDAKAKDEKDKDEPDANMAASDGEYKTATLFPSGSSMGTLKMLTFFRKGPFELKAQYTDASTLIPGTPLELGTYKIDVPASEIAKKVKVRAKLTLHGTFIVESATVEEEEEFEDVVKEKRELPPAEPKEGEAPAAEAPAPEAPPPADAPPADAPAEGAEGEKKEEPKKEEPKKEEKKYEWVEVKKMKKRTKKTDVSIVASGTPGLDAKSCQARKDEESAMQAEMNEILDTDAKKNDLETYVYDMRDKTSSSGTYGPFITDADRDTFHSELTKTEDWIYDTYDATKVQYVEKLTELKAIGEPCAWRANEDSMRADWIKAVEGTITNYKAAAQNPGEKYGHIAEEKLGKIITNCDDAKKWLDDLVAKQAALPKTEKPVLLCAEMEKKNQELAKQADEILKEPKPAPPKEEKKEEEEPKPEEKAEGQEAKPETEGPTNADVD